MSTFRDVLAAVHYSDALTLSIKVEDDDDALILGFYGGPATVLWGDGTSDIVGPQEVIHKYKAGRYTVRMYLGAKTFTVFSHGSTCKIQQSNENWSRYPALRNLRITSSKQSWLLLNSLPNNGDNSRFIGCPFAILNISEIPKGITNMRDFANGCHNAVLPFTELPDGLVGNNDNMFYDCRIAQFTISRLPDGITSLSQAFQNCAAATISFDRLPPRIANLFSAFQGCEKLTVNLDDLADNAPDGGYTELTNISAAFNSCPGVTGSRSRFLAACPNIQNSEYAFNGTNTTE